MGLHVETAQDGEDAIFKYKESESKLCFYFDVILIDKKMPTMN